MEVTDRMIEGVREGQRHRLADKLNNA